LSEKKEWNNQYETIWNDMPINDKIPIIETWFDKKKMKKGLRKNQQLRKMGTTPDDIIQTVASSSWNELSDWEKKYFYYSIDAPDGISFDEWDRYNCLPKDVKQKQTDRLFDRKMTDVRGIFKDDIQGKELR